MSEKTTLRVARRGKKIFKTTQTPYPPSLTLFYFALPFWPASLAQTVFIHRFKYIG